MECGKPLADDLSSLPPFYRLGQFLELQLKYRLNPYAIVSELLGDIRTQYTLYSGDLHRYGQLGHAQEVTHVDRTGQ